MKFAELIRFRPLSSIHLHQQPSFFLSSAHDHIPIAELIKDAPLPKKVSLSDMLKRGMDFEDLQTKHNYQSKNFSIIAHIDHGKSTLADRILELTGAVSRIKNDQMLDTLDVERERGITVKAQSATMIYTTEDSPDSYLFNLIDTPGHVDFRSEVTRSMMAIQGVLLLVDACQGIQAQTLAHWYTLQEKGITVIPVINKIDMKSADPLRVASQIETSLSPLTFDDCVFISARTGEGVPYLLQQIASRIPPPPPSNVDGTRLIIYDALYETHRGVLAKVFVESGSLEPSSVIKPHIHVPQQDSSNDVNRTPEEILEMETASPLSYRVQEVGILTPYKVPLKKLTTGQIGYMFASMKSVRDAPVGQSFFDEEHPVPALPGFEELRHTVFCGLFPIESTEYTRLQDAIEKLTLNDASVSITNTFSPAVGNGFHCGFLGLLHLDVFRTRLEQEYGASVIITAPTVEYHLTLKDGTKIKLDKPQEFPDPTEIAEIQEPIVEATIITPREYMKPLMKLSGEHRGELQSQEWLDSFSLKMIYQLPLAEIATTFFDSIKSLSSGFASFDYVELGYTPAKLAKLDILVHGEMVPPLSTIVHKESLQSIGRKLVDKLAEILDRKQFNYAVQAAVNGKVVARATVRAYRSDVLVKLKNSADLSRKKKLLEAQKKGKSRMKKFGQIDISSDVFVKMLQING